MNTTSILYFAKALLQTSLCTLVLSFAGDVRGVDVLPGALGGLRDGQDALRADRRDRGPDVHHRALPHAHAPRANILGN